MKLLESGSDPRVLCPKIVYAPETLAGLSHRFVFRCGRLNLRTVEHSTAETCKICHSAILQDFVGQFSERFMKVSLESTCHS